MDIRPLRKPKWYWNSTVKTGIIIFQFAIICGLLLFGGSSVQESIKDTYQKATNHQTGAHSHVYQQLAPQTGSGQTRTTSTSTTSAASSPTPTASCHSETSVLPASVSKTIGMGAGHTHSSTVTIHLEPIKTKSHYSKHHSEHHSDHHTHTATSKTLSSTLSEDAALATQVAHLIDSRPSLNHASLLVNSYPEISSLCARTNFTSGVYILCHSFGGPNFNANHGGMSNARNRYTTCPRLAIDAGAGMIFAPLMQRDNDNLQNTNWKQVCPDTMLDVEEFIETWSQICPEMPVRRCDDDSGILYKYRTPDHDHRSGSFTNGTFKEMVDKTIIEAGEITRQDISNESSVKVEFGDVFMGWNYTASNETSLKKEMFRAFPFAPHLVRLGNIVRDAAVKAAGGKEMVGIHFRAEGDWPSEVLNATAQIDFYAEELRKWNRGRRRGSQVEHIYLSCGSAERIEMFREAMAPLGFTVHDKISLLNGTSKNQVQVDAMRAIEELNFDQRAVVEYIPLKDSEYFLGLLPSTLSYIVAYERALDQKDWFKEHILKDSWRGEGLAKHWEEKLQMRGDGRTKLLVVDGQSELSDAFP